MKVHVGMARVLATAVLLVCALVATAAQAPDTSTGTATALDSPALVYTPDMNALRLIDAAAADDRGMYESQWGAPMYPVVGRTGWGEFLYTVDAPGSPTGSAYVNRVNLLTGSVDASFHGACEVAGDGQTGFNGRVLPDDEAALTFVACNGELGVFDDTDASSGWLPTNCADEDIAMLLDIDTQHQTLYYTTGHRDVRTYNYGTNATDGVFFAPSFDIRALAVVSPSHLYIVERSRLVECVQDGKTGVWTFTLINDEMDFGHVSYDGTQGIYTNVENALYTCDLFACNATLSLIRELPVTMDGKPFYMHYTFSYDHTSEKVYWSELNTDHMFTDAAIVKRLDLLHAPPHDKGYEVSTVLQTLFPLDVAGSEVTLGAGGVSMDIFFISYELVAVVSVQDDDFGDFALPGVITRELADPELLVYDADADELYVYADDNIYRVPTTTPAAPHDVVHGVNIDAMAVGNANVFTVGPSDSGASHVAVRRYPTRSYEVVLLATIPSPGLADMPASAMLYDGAGDRVYVAVPHTEHASALYFVDNAQYCVLGCVFNELQPAARTVRPLALSADVFRVYVPTLALEEQAVSLLAFDYADGANTVWMDVLPGNGFVSDGFTTGFVAQDGYGYYVAADALGHHDGPGVYRVGLTNATEVERVLPLTDTVLQLKTSLVRANGKTARRVLYTDQTGRVVLYDTETGATDEHHLSVSAYEVAVDTRDDDALILFVTETELDNRILRCDLGAGGACMPFVHGDAGFRISMLWVDPNMGALYFGNTYPQPELWMVPDNSTTPSAVSSVVGPAGGPLGQLVGIDVEGARVTYAASNGQNAIAQSIPGSPTHTMVTGFSMPAGMVMVPSTPTGGLPDTTTQLAWLSVDASTPPVCENCPLFTSKQQTLSLHDNGAMVPTDMRIFDDTTVVLRPLPTPQVVPPTPTPTPTPTPSPTPTHTPSPTPTPTGKHDKNDALTIGLAVGGGLLAVSALAAGYIIMRRRRTHSINTSERSLDEYHLI